MFAPDGACRPPFYRKHKANNIRTGFGSTKYQRDLALPPHAATAIKGYRHEKAAGSGKRRLQKNIAQDEKNLLKKLFHLVFP
jgi:hypothetical protein